MNSVNVSDVLSTEYINNMIGGASMNMTILIIVIILCCCSSSIGIGLGIYYGWLGKQTKTSS